MMNRVPENMIFRSANVGWLVGWLVGWQCILQLMLYQCMLHVAIDLQLVMNDKH
jgi:hypothetical protein